MISEDTTPTAMRVARDLLDGLGNTHRARPPLKGFADEGPANVPPELIAALILALVQALQQCRPSASMGYVYLTEKDFGRFDWLPWNRRAAKREKAVRRAVALAYKGNQDDLPYLYCELMGLVSGPDGRADLWLLYSEAKAVPSLTWIDKDAFMRD